MTVSFNSSPPKTFEVSNNHSSSEISPIHSCVSKQHGGLSSVYPDPFSSPGDESTRSAGITASEESDSEFGISVSATAASINRSVSLRKKQQTLERLEQSTGNHSRGTSLSKQTKPRNSQPAKTKNTTSYDSNPFFDNSGDHPFQDPQPNRQLSRIESSASSFGALEYSNSSLSNSHISFDSETQALPDEDTFGFVFVKTKRKYPKDNTENQSNTGDPKDTASKVDSNDNMFCYLSLSSDEDEAITPDLLEDRAIDNDKLSTDPEPERPSLDTEQLILAKSDSFRETSLENKPLVISKVGPQSPIDSRHHVRQSFDKKSNMHHGLRHRKHSINASKQDLNQTDDFSNFSSDDESVTLSSSSSSRRKTKSKLTQRPLKASNPSQPYVFSNKSLLTDADLVNEPFYKLINFEYAHAVEAFLLIVPLVYAFYIRKRDTELFSVIDALDRETPALFEQNSDGSFSSPLLSMLFFRARSSIVYDTQFLVRFTLLTMMLLIGIFQVMRLAYLSSQLVAKQLSNSKQGKIKFSLKHYTVSTFNAFFPEVLYTSILPPFIALATNPQHLAFFHANVLATLAYVPFPFLSGDADLRFPILIPPIKLPFLKKTREKPQSSKNEEQTHEYTEIQLWTNKFVSLSNIVSVRRVFCALLEPTLPSVMDHVLTIQEMLQYVVQQSLSPVETFLLATLLVNLFYFGSFNTSKSRWHDPSLAAGPTTINARDFKDIRNVTIPNYLKTELAIAAVPAVVLRAIVFGACCIAVCPILPYVSKIMNIEKFKTSRPLSFANKTKAYNTQINYTKKILAVYVPTFIVVVFWLYLYTDLPDWSSSVDFQSTTVFSFFSLPFDFIFNRVLFPSQQETSSHLKIAGYWLTILAVVVPLVQSTSGSWSQVDLRRKVWHITIVLMFLPVGLPSHPTFTKLCMAGATFIFLAIEFIRVTTIPPLGRAIHTSLLKYLDPRDTCGPIIVSHIFLLVGISVPMYLCNSPAGIICLGLGDAAASVMGHKYGRTKWRWPHGNKKTVEGTVSFVIASVLGLSLYKWVILKHFYPQQYAQPYVLDTYNPFASFDSENKDMGGLLASQVTSKGLTLTKMVIVSVMTALLEAFSSMNDNVIVPLYMTALLQLC